ncbi:NAD(P)H-binding protein [Streptomyces sp. NPDC048172]|uniref:NAD(P)H-binding protein n=1 Tax=Streptomyces sp. NPDC048172 TaxID=3365505 RepID=UPI00371CDB32
MFLVTGATGNVGRPLVAELAAAGAKVRALTRDPAAARFPEGVEAARTDDPAAMDGVEALFLNAAVVWDGGAGPLLRQARESGVRRVVALSSSSVTGTLDMPADNPISRHHHELEAEVEASGMEWTHLRADVFAVNTRGWASQIRAGEVVRDAYGWSRSVPLHEDDVAAVAARALLTGGLAGQAPVLTGPEALTKAEQVRLIGEALGRPVRFEEIPAAEARAAMTAAGVPGDVADTLLDLAARCVDTHPEVSPEVERITGRPARTYARWARDHVADFR